MLTTAKHATKDVNSQSSFVRYIKLGSNTIVFWDVFNLQEQDYARKPGEVGKKLPAGVLHRSMLDVVLNRHEILSMRNLGPFRYIRCIPLQK
jgi:hypothetical protein